MMMREPTPMCEPTPAGADYELAFPHIQVIANDGILGYLTGGYLQSFWENFLPGGTYDVRTWVWGSEV